MGGREGADEVAGQGAAEAGGDNAGLARLRGLVETLRGPGGCPWDQAQTHASLCPFILEEAREVVAAVDGGDPAALCEELGDVLLQVLLHARLAEEAGAFTITDVLSGLETKLIRRHPHVFGERRARDAADAQRIWDGVKRAEAGADPGGGWLDRVPRSGGALAEAHGLGRRAAEVGLDWPDPRAAWTKVEEERGEFLEAWDGAAPGAGAAGAPAGPVEEELGDLLLALASVARLLGLDAELTLARANDKFRRRFAAVEASFAAGGGVEAMRRAGAAGLDQAWRRAKLDPLPAPARPPGGSDSEMGIR